MSWIQPERISVHESHETRRALILAFAVFWTVPLGFHRTRANELSLPVPTLFLSWLLRAVTRKRPTSTYDSCVCSVFAACLPLSMFLSSLLVDSILLTPKVVEYIFFSPKVILYAILTM